VRNLERGGRLERVRSISTLVILWRAIRGLACAPWTKAHERNRQDGPVSREKPLGREKPMKVSVSNEV
jgi:hypothetical protein